MPILNDELSWMKSLVNYERTSSTDGGEGEDMMLFIFILGVPIIITILGYRSFHGSDWGKTWLFIAIPVLIAVALMFIFIPLLIQK